MESRVHGAASPRHDGRLGGAVRTLAAAKFFNLRTDPYEFADVTSNSYYEWFIYHAYILYGAMAIAQKFAETFKDYPVIQKPNTFTIDDAVKVMGETASGGGH